MPGNIAKNKKETDSQAENNLVVTSWEGEVDRGKADREGGLRVTSFYL